MSSNGCYLFLKNKLAKGIFRNTFLDMDLMQLKFDDIFEMSVFGCSFSVLTDDDQHAGIYLETSSHLSYNALKSLLGEVLYEYEYDLVDKENYCCDTEFFKGFIIWQI